ncbi:MAG: tripartite tricarboxylate transporter TctB family protein [Burkholderiales bacterium]
MQNASRLSLEAAFDILLFAIGGVIAYVSWGYGFGSISRPGPGLYPFFVGAFIAVFAFFIVIGRLRTRPTRPVLDCGSASTFTVMTATFCCWILLMPLLGYVLVTLLATFVFAKAVRLDGWRKPLALSCGTALFIYLLFDKWLYIDLPRGIFGD